MRVRNVSFGLKAAVLAVALGVAAPAVATAGGVARGKMGGTGFRSKGRFAACAYDRATGVFALDALQLKVKARRRSANVRWLVLAGSGGGDPTAPGATFPITLTDTAAVWVDAPDVGIGTDPSSIPGWTAEGGAVQIHFTRYRRGRFIGTFEGTMQPADTNVGASPIAVSGTFTLRCEVQ